MAWHTLDATSDGLRVIIAKTPTVAATVGVAGAATSLTALANKLSKSPWPMGWSPRGFTIEARLGGNLPAAYPTFDKWNPTTRVATSIKSVDLSAKTYQNPANLQKKIAKYIDTIANFVSANRGGVAIDELDLAARELHLAIPRAASAEQQAVLAEMAEYARTKGVDLIVEVIR